MDRQSLMRRRRMAVAVFFALAMCLINPIPSLSATGWYNWYNSANTTMYWMYNGNWRLGYTYGAGQWYDCTQLGGKDNWNTLGASGQAPTFLGNASIGWYLPVGNGWSYGYDTRSDAGYWMNSSGNFRFGYQYGSGQWWDQNLNQWNQIGAASVQSPFIGDGKLHDMKNSWSYEYLTSNDTGYWATGGNFRLAYGYTGGVWFDDSNTWRALSSTGVGSAFIGNAAIGAYYYLNNNWYYGYDVNQNIGYWKASTGPFRFAYYYPGGIWYDEGNTGGWISLGPAGLSSAFLGDGWWHNLDPNWSFNYVASVDFAQWESRSSLRIVYGYKYGTGQWCDNSPSGGWLRLNVAAMPAQFIGDGQLHQFSGGDWFHGDETQYYWRVNGQDIYWYTFGTETWKHWHGGQWEALVPYSDVRYLYNHTFVDSILQNQPGSYQDSYDRPDDLMRHYNVWQYGSDWNLVTSWNITNPGSDNRFTFSGDLNILWVNTWHDTSGYWGLVGIHNYVHDWNQGFAGYTKEDVVVFAADFEENRIGFKTMVDCMTLARDYYGMQIRNVTVAAHGNDHAWAMGEYMSVDNYKSFQDDWQRWGRLMTSDGSIVSLACDVGNARVMLDAIHNWTGKNIYANTNPSNIGPDGLDTAWDPSIWNNNFIGITWEDNGTYGAPDRKFEYSTSGDHTFPVNDYRWLLLW